MEIVCERSPFFQPVTDLLRELARVGFFLAWSSHRKLANVDLYRALYASLWSGDK
jgi:hypothetical protein